MPVQSQNPLPQINRFLAGLITNRNPIDTPFSIVGLNIVQHHDALIDGLNMEISAYNTLIRRPGFVPFQTQPAQAREMFNYKDLSGNLSLFYDVAGDLYQGATKVSGSVTGTAIWSTVAAGNFMYAVNGKTALRVNNTALTTSVPMGIGSPQQPPKTTVNTQSKPYFTSAFIPTGDTIAGLMVVTDGNNDRILTITINSGSVHFNVQYTGNVISPNDNYTETNVQTQTGTAPNTTTTNLVTDTTGYTGTLAGTGITNGVVAYYPTQGLSTIDFDYAFTGSMTLSQLVTIINAISFTITAANIPASATNLLTVFVQATLLTGMVASSLYPDTAAQAITLTSNGK